MKKFSKVLLGLMLVGAGVCVALDVLGILDINYSALLDGWWTLFIIIPCLISVIGNGPNTGNILGLGIGVLLFLGSRDIIEYGMAFKLIVPAIIIAVGVGIIFKQLLKKDKSDKKIDDKFKKSNADGGEDYTSAFSGQDVNFSGETLKSFTANAIFGGMKFDFRGATLSEDIVIEASAIFGGIDFIVPEDMPIKVKSTSIFGGIGNKHGNAGDAGMPCIYIKGTCLFGGMEIK